MSVYRRVTPLIVALLLTVLFVGVVTIHTRIGTEAPVPLEGAALTALKYKGFNYLSNGNGYASADSDSSLNALKSTGANYVALVVNWVHATSTSNTVYADPNKTPTDAAVITTINSIHARGMGVMLKLGLYRGDNSANVLPTDTAAWFASYATMTNHYARIAHDHGVELFCIGTEFNVLDMSNYSLWSTLIRGVRAIYSGPLTYAWSAAWWSDSLTQVPFWGLLDYVGMDTYFPLSGAQTPSVANLVAGWSSNNVSGLVRDWMHEIETLQATVNKPIIFTEIGYQSIDYAAKNPANPPVGPYNGLAQANCYEAALRVFANKSWFAGMFWFAWSSDPKDAGVGNTNVWPRNKPAQSVLIANWLPYSVLVPSVPA